MKLGLHIKHLNSAETEIDDFAFDVEYTPDEFIIMSDSLTPLINTLVAQLTAQSIPFTQENDHENHR